MQKYDLSKKTERFWKTTFKGANPKELSSTNPSLYAERFTQFMQSKVFKTDVEQQPLMTNERSAASFLKNIEQTSDYSLNNGSSFNDNIID